MKDLAVRDNHGDSHRKLAQPVKPLHRDDPSYGPRRKCNELIESASAQSVIGSPESKRDWAVVIEYCSRHKIDFAEAISEHIICGKTAIENLFLTHDWHALLLVMEHIPEGLYARDRVIRQGNVFAQAKNEKADGVGVYKNFQSTYCGHYREGKKDGEGHQHYIYGDGYDGSWKDDEPWGWGARYFGKKGKTAYVGYFEKYEFLGDPNRKTTNFLKNIREGLSALKVIKRETKIKGANDA